MSDPVARRIGLAGAGWVAPHHLKAWQRLHGRAAVVAIADPNVEAARELAKAFGVPAVYPSVEAMLERGAPRRHRCGDAARDPRANLPAGREPRPRDCLSEAARAHV